MEGKCEKDKINKYTQWEMFEGKYEVLRIFGNADPGFSGVWPRERYLLVFEGMDILYSTSNSNQWSSQNTEHWDWVGIEQDVTLAKIIKVMKILKMS